ncbi:MAG: hypothetical protein ACJAUN_001938 [Alcanivorax sp.]|jgi:hypothetical protein|uniref:hypothetical protein n=1 Tax=Alcanivorax sp. TaxID=1872427 RepID=UPI0039E3D52C
MTIKFFVPAIFSSALLASGLAMAASDGSMGTGASASSTGTAVITLNVPDLIKISDMNDMTINQGNSFSATDNVCVFRNLAGGYGVVAQSSNDANGAGTSGAFTLSDGGTSEVNYSVTWDGTPLTEDTAETGLTSSNTTEANCQTSGPNVALGVSATENQVGAATTATDHTDTLTVIITAE